MLSSSYRIILLCLLTVRLCLSRKSLDVRVESVDIGVYDVLDRVCDSGLRSLADTCGCVCERERGGYVFLDCVSKISKKKTKDPASDSRVRIGRYRCTCICDSVLRSYMHIYICEANMYET